MSESAILGVDVGGTSIKARLTTISGTIIQEWRRLTPTQDHTGQLTAAVIAELVDCARLLANVHKIGVVVPGIVDEKMGVCLHAVNLGWHNLAIQDVIEAVLGTPIAFGQDVRAGCLAEVCTGAAANISGAVVFVPIGTGLASALAIDGHVLDSTGWAGEIGQVVLTSGPFRGSRAESIASASGIARASGTANSKQALDLVKAGDPQSIAAWDAAISVLADALSWIVAATGPELVVIGGGLAEAGHHLLDPLSKELESRLYDVQIPHLVKAAHGDNAAVAGASILASRRPDNGHRW